MAKMANPETEILRLFSVPLTREKQIQLEDEVKRYADATNWVIKEILRQKIVGAERAIEVLKEPFGKRFGGSREYLSDVVMTARVEIGRHKRLAQTVVSLRDKDPYFKPGRMILSQPLVRLDHKALVLTMSEGTTLPIPFDKRSRNRAAEELAIILKGEKRDAPNKRYGRIRLTYNREGYVEIDVRVSLPRDRPPL
ncbi:MAG: hypothetical protein DRO87_03035 [Candidatus Thorarchaeota archaeon]|nr:MAG: hypothetical protein DRP09_08225 [Candidatus Thorarchaeota archaeon]RLI59385.1 MAG: hypothetical protein DRO87_03035 [Candidatus Thorarchaeota archaeon]